MKTQYVLMKMSDPAEVTKPVTRKEITRLCRLSQAAAYVVGGELNHKHFPPDFAGDCHFKLELSAGDEYACAINRSMRKGRLVELGYVFKN